MTVVKNTKSFRLLPAGLFEILKSLVVFDHVLPTAGAIFLQWYLDSYGMFFLSRLSGKICGEKLKSIEELLGSDYIFRTQISLIEHGVADLNAQIWLWSSIARRNAGKGKGTRYSKVLLLAFSIVRASNKERPCKGASPLSRFTLIS